MHALNPLVAQARAEEINRVARRYAERPRPTRSMRRLRRRPRP
jgi:hypothetical protein